MARYRFGIDAGAWLVRIALDGALRATDGTLTAWSTHTGGVRLTDLTTLAGEPIDQVPAVRGQYGFYGPDGVMTLYVDGGAGERELLVGAEAWDDVKSLLDNPYSGGLNVAEVEGDPGVWEITGTPSTPVVDLGDGVWQIGA